MKRPRNEPIPVPTLHVTYIEAWRHWIVKRPEAERPMRRFLEREQAVSFGRAMVRRKGWTLYINGELDR